MLLAYCDSSFYDLRNSMIRKCLVLLLLLSLLASCSDINDCKCIIEKDGVRQEIIHRDYEGNCAELNENQTQGEFIFCE